MTARNMAVLIASLGLAFSIAGEADAAVFKMYWTDDAGVLRRADADGSNPRKLVPGKERDYNASFSYDGGAVGRDLGMPTGSI